MLYYIMKVVISAVLIVLVAEIGKRSSVAGAVLASIPLVSVLGMIWLYLDTGDALKVAALASDIVWLVLPSLVLFITLPWLLKIHWNFWLALSTSIGLTVAAYGLTLWLLHTWPAWTKGA